MSWISTFTKVYIQYIYIFLHKYPFFYWSTECKYFCHLWRAYNIWRYDVTSCPVAVQLWARAGRTCASWTTYWWRRRWCTSTAERQQQSSRATWSSLGSVSHSTHQIYPQCVSAYQSFAFVGESELFSGWDLRRAGRRHKWDDAWSQREDDRFQIPG